MDELLRVIAFLFVLFFVLLLIAECVDSYREARRIAETAKSAAWEWSKTHESR